MGKFKCGQKVIVDDKSSVFYNQEAYIVDTINKSYGCSYRISLDGGIGEWFFQQLIPCISFETITDKEILDIIETSNSAS